jgi:CelD/BcsL family acetyltransferase involved in cellulose biosynthesis
MNPLGLVIRMMTLSIGTAAKAVAIDLYPASEAALVAAVWQHLESTLGTGLTNSWDWVDTWLRHYGDEVSHHFAVATGPHGVCGVALLTHGVGQSRGPIPVRTLHLGTAGEEPGETIWVEYNRFLVESGYRASFAAGLLRTVRSAHLPWDILQLDGFDPDEAEPFLRLDSGFDVTRKTCHVANLATMRENGPFAGFKRETVAKIRKNRRRFEERYGPITTRWAETVDDGLEILRELIPLHQDRWHRAGQPGSFSSPRFTGFHQELIRRLLPKGQIVLFRVTAGEQMIGTFYGFVEAGVLYHYQWGLAQFDQNSLSPGFVVGALCMEEASARGIDELNWLAGDTRYKRELSNEQRELVWAELHRGPRMVAIDAMKRARAWQRRFRSTAEATGQEDER